MVDQQHHISQSHGSEYSSTLEVASVNHVRHDAAGNAPEVYYDLYSESAQKIYYDQSEAPQYIPPHGPEPYNSPPPPQPESTGFCGLSRKALWIIIITLVLVIGGLAGGLAGGLSARNQTSSNTTSPQSTSTPGSSNTTNTTGTTGTTGSTTGPLENSQLAAINWTDSDNVLRRAVFYQRNGSLYFSQHHTSNDTWSQFNLSDVFAHESAANALKVKSGTPLAAAAVPIDDVNWLAANVRSGAFAACLYFIDTDSHLRELCSNDYDLSVWFQGGLKDLAYVATEDSHLGVTAYYCPNIGSGNCTNNFVASYQDRNENVNIIFGPDWTTANQYQVAPGYPGGSIAMIPIASNGGRNITDVSEMRVFYYTNNAFSYDYWNLYSSANGLSTGNRIITSQSVIDDKVPQIVAAPADFHSHAIAVSMDGSSKFTAAFYDVQVSTDNGWRVDQQVTFKNEDGSSTDGGPNIELTSIAMDHNGSLYGISSDGNSIISYTWSSEASVRYDFTWAEKIAVE